MYAPWRPNRPPPDSTDLRHCLPDIPRKLLLALALVALCAGWQPNSIRAEGHHPVNLTVYFPFGTNQDPTVSTNLRLSLIYGQIGEVRGLDLNGGVSVIRRDLIGAQGTFLYSRVRGRFRGIAVTGLMNHFDGDGIGFQAAAGNLHRNDFGGLQFCAFFNFVEGDMWGAQWSGFFNLTDRDARFVQLSGFSNVTGRDFTGLQASAAFNVTGGELKGIQFGAANLARDMRGFQMGIFNLSAYGKGVQLGLFNWVGNNEGVPIGLVNYSDNGSVDWISYGSNLSAFNTGIRTTVNRFYSMLTIGAGGSIDDIDEILYFSWNYGYGLPLGDRFTLGADLGFVHIAPQVRSVDEPEKNTNLRPAVQARLLGMYRFNPTFEIFAGVGSTAIATGYGDDATSETEPLFVGGISLY